MLNFNLRQPEQEGSSPSGVVWDNNECYRSFLADHFFGGEGGLGHFWNEKSFS